MKIFTAKISLSVKIATAALSLFLEACAEAFMWLAAWLAFFLCNWLIGYTSKELTILFWIGMVILYFLGLHKLKIPTRGDIIHRVEIASNVRHRPLQSLEDIAATTGRRDLWEYEKARQKDLLKKLRYSRPFLNLAARDPYALRIVFILIVTCAYFVAPNTWFEKITNGISLPEQQGVDKIEQPFAQIRITPPLYSGMKPLILNQSSSQEIEILPGSKIAAEIQTSWRQPILELDNNKFLLKQKDGSDIWTVETMMPETGNIKITSFGITRFSQKVKWLSDTAPIIGWNGKITLLPTGEMKIPLKIADDFGIKKLILRGILSPTERPSYFGRPLHIEKEINLTIRNSSVDINTVFDTTGHPWAGKKISLMIEAEDFAGNITGTAPLEIQLPTRSFHDPVSIALATIRSDLLNLRRSPNELAVAVEKILYRPDIYSWDTVTTLALRSVDSRLHYETGKEALEGTASTLWSLALRLEDGQISETQNSLREALDNLQEALQKGADKTEITALMQEMQQALIRHLQTIAQKLQQNAKAAPLPEGMQYNMDLSGLNEFLQKLQDEIKNGNMQGALQKLNELQQLADMMGSSMAQGMPEDAQNMIQNLTDLQNIVSQQKKLLDKTRQQNKEQTPSLSKEQRDIENRTKELVSKVKEDSKSLNDAGNEMNQSSTSLDAADKQASISHQKIALEHLEKSSKDMQQQLQKKMQGMMGMSVSGARQDPLGRSQGQVSDGNTEIPQGNVRKKTDQILKTLREREGDMKRPLEERNYYQRLLKQW